MVTQLSSQSVTMRGGMRVCLIAIICVCLGWVLVAHGAQVIKVGENQSGHILAIEGLPALVDSTEVAHTYNVMSGQLLKEEYTDYLNLRDRVRALETRIQLRSEFINDAQANILPFIDRQTNASALLASVQMYAGIAKTVETFSDITIKTFASLDPTGEVKVIKESYQLVKDITKLAIGDNRKEVAAQIAYNQVLPWLKSINATSDEEQNMIKYFNLLSSQNIGEGHKAVSDIQERGTKTSEQIQMLIEKQQAAKVQDSADLLQLIHTMKTREFELGLQIPYGVDLQQWVKALKDNVANIDYYSEMEMQKQQKNDPPKRSDERFEDKVIPGTKQGNEKNIIDTERGRTLIEKTATGEVNLLYENAPKCLKGQGQYIVFTDKKRFTNCELDAQVTEVCFGASCKDVPVSGSKKPSMQSNWSGQCTRPGEAVVNDPDTGVPLCRLPHEVADIEEEVQSRERTAKCKKLHPDVFDKNGKELPSFGVVARDLETMLENPLKLLELPRLCEENSKRKLARRLRMTEADSRSSAVQGVDLMREIRKIDTGIAKGATVTMKVPPLNAPACKSLMSHSHSNATVREQLQLLREQLGPAINGGYVTVPKNGYSLNQIFQLIDPVIDKFKAGQDRACHEGPGSDGVEACLAESTSTHIAAKKLVRSMISKAKQGASPSQLFNHAQGQLGLSLPPPSILNNLNNVSSMTNEMNQQCAQASSLLNDSEISDFTNFQWNKEGPAFNDCNGRPCF